MSSRTPRSPRARATSTTACPCGLPAAYDDCCGRLHRGEARATTPEQLMRSRFSAFAVHDEAYLLRSWHPRTRPPSVDFDPAMRWLRLDILGSTGGSPLTGEGTVEFRAHYTERGHAGELHENSRFVLHDRAWVYLDGVVGDQPGFSA
ncbi:YchJ family protein [Streptosporangium subroseum]|uniref:YchJ family protein n=1 Tax=Streptosporangium subroseum TaxID=106412 RepID=UPI00308D27CF|nr:YchJ family metal-binding protein [Streptosporangium subroseum]